ncbi:hypothetical protein DL768_002647 [Monosporascus sp. mg162]|nr:hypothetical protein DL768_002647 [Monosporascus sp. mg162]
MAEEAQVTEPSSKKLHPFFVAPRTLSKSKAENVVAPITPESLCSSGSDKLSENADTDIRREEDEDVAGPDSAGRRPKRRKTDSSADSRQSVSKNTRPKRRSRVSAGQSILNHLAPKDDSSVDNSSANDDDSAFTLTTNTAETTISTPLPATQTLTQGAETNSIHTEHAPPNSVVTPPKKLLKLNSRTGTIGSPPKSKSTIPPDSVRPKKRGRKPKRLLITIRYGGDDESRIRIGQQIEDVLGGIRKIPSRARTVQTDPAQQQPQLQTPKDPTPKKTPPKNARTATPKKPTHPFFLGKNNADTEAADGEKRSGVEKPPKRQTIFTSTPCSPNRFNRHPQKFNIPQFGLKSGGLKVPGAQHPAWPWQGISHVRGDGPPLKSDVDTQSLLPTGRRKAKSQEVQVGINESVLYRAGVELNLARLAEEMEALNADDFQPPPPLLQIPRRHFESGKKLQARIAGELYSPISTASKVHPAIIHAFESIPTTLSAFDKATCEGSSWAQKYCPTSAVQVLQNGREAELLRDWLATLKVQAVDTGMADGSKPRSLVVPQKRGRKKQKLDGFVVSSDEEDMDDISEDEGAWAPNANQKDSKKTVVKSASKGGNRLANAVLLSGPHGCGKTATVFAIAKELDFEVFEISPGSRRSGKDIMERVGDMTRNHLVQHQQKEDAPDEDPVEDQVAQDLKSGKQGTMTSFFKPNPPARAPKPKGKSKAEPAQLKGPQGTSTSSAKPQKQKQSLILLEEVDLLYEEDKQFWVTIISMIAQSKRPFIMTCNDETLVPIQNLNLHGIFRFSSPPKELAVDLLLLIAANEGHALTRHAVESLYDSRNQDLRASVAELNYWCQVGVGDPRGGFNWFYPRWPKGSDVDEEGDVVRVVSEGTYQVGMGWLGRDTITAASPSRSIAEELQQQTWHNWSLDLSSSQQPENFPAWANAVTGHGRSPQDRLILLKAADDYATRMSDADLCSFDAYAQPNEVPIDSSFPALPSKVREDFIIGQQLLEASPTTQYDTTSADIATGLKLLARSQLEDSKPPDRQGQTAMKPLCEPQALLAIEQSFKDKLQPDSTIGQTDYSLAFDPLAASEKVLTGGHLDTSVFNRTMKMIALEVAPYVRSIVSYDQRLQKERLLRSNLISEGGKPGRKRMRNTRSAYSALEGGSRASTRREKYFSADINPYFVMRTGGEGWDALASKAAGEQSVASSASPSSVGDMDVSSD